MHICRYVMGILDFPCHRKTSLMHWAHRIEDTNSSDVVRYGYLFKSMAVRIQYNQGKYSRGSLREPQKRLCGKKMMKGKKEKKMEEQDSVTIIKIINTNITKL